MSSVMRFVGSNIIRRLVTQKPSNYFIGFIFIDAYALITVTKVYPPLKRTLVYLSHSAIIRDRRLCRTVHATDTVECRSKSPFTELIFTFVSVNTYQFVEQLASCHKCAPTLFLTRPVGGNFCSSSSIRVPTHRNVTIHGQWGRLL